MLRQSQVHDNSNNGGDDTKKSLEFKLQAYFYNFKATGNIFL